VGGRVLEEPRRVAAVQEDVVVLDDEGVCA
jgi:hypothetical protein